MKTYESLITQFCEKDWEDLTNDEKNKLVNSYILFNPIEIPCQTAYKRLVFNILNKTEIESTEEAELKSLFFSAIKQGIERDLEKEWADSN
jgi:hypothetical protein